MLGKVIAITGGTGSWGNELVTQLLHQNVFEVRIISRNEFAQVTMERKFNDPRLKFIIGDVRELDAMTEAFKGVDTVFHLAALKHIPVCEKFPWEAIRTNIEGTQNVIEAAIRNDVQTVVDVSSDKAVAPLNLYGMTKAVGEKLIIHANNRTRNTKFICIRGGNVLGSNGSVVPFFLKQIEKGEMQITDCRMTRYFLTLSEAIQLLFTAVKSDLPGSVFVMKMPSCKIVDLAKTISMLKTGTVLPIKEIGIRQGEKLHEVLISEEESPNAYVWSDNYYMIDVTGKNHQKKERVSFKKYDSNQELMTNHQISEMLQKGGFV